MQQLASTTAAIGLCCRKRHRGKRRAKGAMMVLQKPSFGTFGHVEVARIQKSFLQDGIRVRVGRLLARETVTCCFLACSRVENRTGVTPAAAMLNNHAYGESSVIVQSLSSLDRYLAETRILAPATSTAFVYLSKQCMHRPR